jgi:hypothetical protein
MSWHGAAQRFSISAAARLPTLLRLTSRPRSSSGLSSENTFFICPEMLSKGGNDEILATWGEGNDSNASVFGALDSADQALPDEAVDSDTDRARGQINDWAYRVDGQCLMYSGEKKSLSVCM